MTAHAAALVPTGMDAATIDEFLALYDAPLDDLPDDKPGPEPEPEQWPTTRAVVIDVIKKRSRRKKKKPKLQLDLF